LSSFENFAFTISDARAISPAIRLSPRRGALASLARC
jgi:hypothetical protein